MSRGIILLSGGIDSAAALAWAAQHHEELFAISFLYHMRPLRERFSVYRLLEHFPASLIEVPLPFLKEAADISDEMGRKAPEGYISNRNLIFYSIASYFGETHECSVMVGGHTVEDEEAFPDAASGFMKRLQTLFHDALLLGKLRLEFPLIRMTKLEVVQAGRQWGVPFEHTWSCYWDQPFPCTQCASCTERADAFRHLGTPDPLIPSDRSH